MQDLVLSISSISYMQFYFAAVCFEAMYANYLRCQCNYVNATQIVVPVKSHQLNLQGYLCPKSVLGYRIWSDAVTAATRCLDDEDVTRLHFGAGDKT